MQCCLRWRSWSARINSVSTTWKTNCVSATYAGSNRRELVFFSVLTLCESRHGQRKRIQHSGCRTTDHRTVTSCCREVSLTPFAKWSSTIQRYFRHMYLRPCKCSVERGAFLSHAWKARLRREASFNIHLHGIETLSPSMTKRDVIIIKLYRPMKSMDKALNLINVHQCGSIQPNSNGQLS